MIDPKEIASECFVIWTLGYPLQCLCIRRPLAQVNDRDTCYQSPKTEGIPTDI